MTLSFQIKGRKFMHSWLKDDDPTATQSWNGQVMKKSGSVRLLVMLCAMWVWMAITKFGRTMS